jgi:hypothetical protein
MLDAQTRKRYLALARRRAQPGSGSQQTFLHTRTAMFPVFDLRSIIKQTPFVVVGGVATRLYMPERMTVDLDILILAEDAAELQRELQAANCQQIGTLTVGGATWRLPDSTPLDVIESSEPWAHEAVSRPIPGPTGLPTIDLPYLVLMKLHASRVQDLADITRMLGAADEAMLQYVRTVIGKHMPDALEDVESMIALGRLEFE